MHTYKFVDELYDSLLFFFLNFRELSWVRNINNTTNCNNTIIVSKLRDRLWFYSQRPSRNNAHIFTQKQQKY